MLIGITEKHAGNGTRRKFVGGGGINVGKAKTAENFELGIVGVA
jgi:hypothetical protein